MWLCSVFEALARTGVPPAEGSSSSLRTVFKMRESLSAMALYMRSLMVGRQLAGEPGDCANRGDLNSPEHHANTIAELNQVARGLLLTRKDSGIV